MAQFKVLYEKVKSFNRGDIISQSDLPSMSFSRLLRIGAVQLVGSDSGTDTEDTEEETSVTPAVVPPAKIQVPKKAAVASPVEVSSTSTATDNGGVASATTVDPAAATGTEAGETNGPVTPRGINTEAAGVTSSSLDKNAS